MNGTKKVRKMKVNDLVKTIGYNRNRLSHFTFYLYNYHNDDGLTISDPSLDDYIFLCDRKILD